MHLGQEVGILIKKEFMLEWRQKYALNGILLYLCSTIFICYLSFYTSRGALNPITWNTLFWIIQLFTSVNAVAKSFILESPGRHMYYYTLASPTAIIVAKMVYNAVLTMAVAAIGLLFYTIILGNPVQDFTFFVVNMLAGSVGFSVILTLSSGIAAKARNSSALMAILSFPVITPVLLLSIRLSKNAMDGLAMSVNTSPLLTLFAVDLIVGATAIMLFPFLWRT